MKNNEAKTWFVSRHPGAIEWALRQGISPDMIVSHLDTGIVGTDDTVIGTLPVNLAARVCARGARYLHLSLELPVGWRGRDLSADELMAAGAATEQYEVKGSIHAI